MTSPNTFSVYEVACRFYGTQPVQLQCYETIGSTNTEAKASQHTTPAVYIAKQQSAGRGRYDRQWLQSGAKTSDQLFISWVFPLAQPTRHLTAPLVGLHLYKCLREVWPNGAFGLKPPNDIYLGNKKILGLLVEAQQQKSFQVVIGLGLNIFSHPDTVSEAGHLAESLTVTHDMFTTFLAAVEAGWPAVLHQARQEILTPQNKEALIFALNSGAANPQPILEVTDQCDLITASATVSWRAL